MATPPRVSENTTTQRNYLAQLTIAAAASQAIRELWAQIAPLSSETAFGAFRASAHAVVNQYAPAAASEARNAYRTARRDAGVTSVPRMPAITLPEPAKVDKELDWIESQMRDMAGRIAEIEAQLLAESTEAFEKVVADEAREYTVAAVVGDERALGFRRVARPDACAWCLALAIRKTSRRGLAKDFKRYGMPGALGGDEHWGVYKSRVSAGQLPPGSDEINRFHFNCHCTVEPIFDASFVPPQHILDADALYADADDFNDFRRRLRAQRNGDELQDPAPVLPLPSMRPEQTAGMANLLANLDAAMRVA